MFSPICRRYATIVPICLLIGASGGGVLSMVFGARKGAFWTEPPPRQTSRLQGPNFADMAEQLKPAVVNISTTHVVQGSPHGLGGLLPQRPSDERDLLNEFLKRFFGGSASQQEAHKDSLGSGFIIDKGGYGDRGHRPGDQLRYPDQLGEGGLGPAAGAGQSNAWLPGCPGGTGSPGAGPIHRSTTDPWGRRGLRGI